MSSEKYCLPEKPKVCCKINDYKFNSKLKKNYGFSSLYIAKHLPTEKYVLAKKYNIDVLSIHEWQLIQAEIIKIRQFKHKNILSIVSSFSYGKSLYIIVPLMCYGSCKNILKCFFPTGFPEEFLAVIIRDILQGLAYLHHQGFIHRSICANHIFLNQTNAALGGLRHCVSTITHGKYTSKLHHLETVNKQCLNWLAPEVLEQNLLGYTELSDIYSLGITCCELANGMEPFCDLQPTFMLTEKLRGNLPILLDRSTCPDHEIFLGTKRISSVSSTPDNYKSRLFTDDFHHFTELCMKKRPSDRWTAYQLLSHSFLKQSRNTTISKEVQLHGLDSSQCIEVMDNSNTDVDEHKKSESQWSWKF